MRKLKKTVAASLIAAMMAISVAGCGDNSVTLSSQERNEGTESEEISEVDEMVGHISGGNDVIGHSQTAGKKETVYVIMDADGNEQEKLVSTILKNADGKDTVDDVTNLTDIETVKGTASYTDNGNGTIKWQADGNDIYYQGKSNSEAPVTVGVSYELDGKKITANELAGKSGHLTIKFTYKNNTGKEVEIDGKKTTIYQPFTMVSGLILDNEKVKNVTVSSGQAIDSGNQTIVAGIAMPGLKESLDIDEEKLDLDIPEDVVVEADVTDFEMMMTVTYASNSVLSAFDLDNVDTIDDFKDSVNKLTDGMSQLKNGANDLSDGALKLSDGAASLSNGVDQVKTGADSLSKGANELSAGASKVDAGAAELSNGLATLNAGIPELSSGVAQLSGGSAALYDGATTLVNSNAALTDGASQLAGGLTQLNGALSSEDAAASMNALLSGSANFSDNLGNAAAGLNQVVAGYDYNQGNVAAMMGGLSQYANALIASGDPDSVTYGNYILALISTYKGMYDNTSSVAAGLNGLNQAYPQINSGIQVVANSVANAKAAVAQLTDGATVLSTGINTYVAGVNAIYEGIAQMHAGIGSLNTKVPTLTAGVNQLTTGSKSLAEGTSTLSQGSATLAKGAATLASGTNELSEGAKTLASGTNSLLDGSISLKNGIVQYDQEGISKIADLVNEDLQLYYDKLMAIKDYSNEFESFAGSENGIETSVRFIYKTGEISK